MMSLAEVGWSSTKAPETRERRRLGARPLVGARSHENGLCHGSSTTRPGGRGASSSTRGRARPSCSSARPQFGVGRRRHREAGRRHVELGCRPNLVPEDAVDAGSGFGRPRQRFIEASPWNFRGNLIPPTAPFGGVGVAEKYKKTKGLRFSRRKTNHKLSWAGLTFGSIAAHQRQSSHNLRS
jgi:hypothetical protein